MFPTAMPAPRLPDPMAAPPLRWGVLGTGWVAERFAAALHRDTRQRVVAVGSRSVASAKEFADRIGTQRAHGSYADLVADPEVDVVYIATPHNHHRAHALLALDAGKHVLVEKPIALNAAEAQEIAERAAARDVYCAEALWTFCLPRYDVIRQLLDDGVLGDVHTVLADNGEWLPGTHRIWVLGEPEQVIAVGQDVPGGEVNGQVSTVLRHSGHDALYVTAVEAARRIAAGSTETPLRPLTDSIATLRVVDEVRRQIGVTFVEETAPGVPANR